MEAARRINKWTQDEDMILLQRLREQQARSPPDKAVDWQKIAAALPGRTNKDCRKRWFNVLNGDLRKGPWTAEEDRLLGQAVEAEGKVWMRVSTYVPRRTADQCAKRWQHFLDPALDRSEWTESECQILWEAVQKQGRRWLQIRNDLFPQRSPNSLKNQYAFMSRHCCKAQRNCAAENEGLSAAGSSPASHIEDLCTVTSQPFNDDNSLISNDTQLLYPSLEDMILFPAASHNDNNTVMPDCTLPHLTYDCVNEADLSVAGFTDNPDSGSYLQDYTGFEDGFPLNPCSSSTIDHLSLSSGLGTSSIVSAGMPECQSSGADLPLPNCSVMTVRLTNPAPEAVHEFIRILMAHQQQVTIDIEN
ncbi:hypothetical protein H109_06831 [Trichophyton interdigitale MR816]|uniref:Uncharacterized protein n=1 Tax=Trichophyton interdigitale (strain MR816) TaxID=1215338 RepID=A0A059J047_TRIIM|nr:hypothetical protein H101_02940 [Trichophyton interdigitale H6]KDB21231.1 hypothetical protein H109_06831 [Trichophyton interdigitale MR816]